MRSWPLPATPTPADPSPHAAPQLLGPLIDALGQPGFGAAVLQGVQAQLPAASWSVYRLGARPALLLSAACGVPDTTRECWCAYLSGPHRADRSFGADVATPPATPQLCHLDAREAPAEHRAKVYEAHGMAERLSLAQGADGALLAINFYRHAHQPAFGAGTIERLATLAPALLALVRKHVALGGPAAQPASPTPHGDAQADAELAARLHRLCPALTAREQSVCVRLLRGLTLDGIAADLGLALPTVKTYRQRAFARLGIHFRNELFARVLAVE